LQAEAESRNPVLYTFLDPCDRVTAGLCDGREQGDHYPATMRPCASDHLTDPTTVYVAA